MRKSSTRCVQLLWKMQKCVLPFYTFASSKVIVVQYSYSLVIFLFLVFYMQNLFFLRMLFKKLQLPRFPMTIFVLNGLVYFCSLVCLSLCLSAVSLASTRQIAVSNFFVCRKSEVPIFIETVTKPDGFLLIF